MLGSHGTTTNIDIAIASPIKDEQDQAMLNKKIISCSEIIILLLLYYESTNLDYIPCNLQQMVINYRWNNVPFYYNLTKIKGMLLW
jgi:hypothetical protein